MTIADHVRHDTIGVNPRIAVGGTTSGVEQMIDYDLCKVSVGPYFSYQAWQNNGF